MGRELQQKWQTRNTLLGPGRLRHVQGPTAMTEKLETPHGARKAGKLAAGVPVRLPGSLPSQVPLKKIKGKLSTEVPPKLHGDEHQQMSSHVTSQNDRSKKDHSRTKKRSPFLQERPSGTQHCVSRGHSSQGPSQLPRAGRERWMGAERRDTVIMIKISLLYGL